MAASGSGGSNNPFAPGPSSSGFSLVAPAKLKKDKRSISRYLKEECTKTKDSKPLHDYLDGVCDPHKPIDDPDTIDWYKWIISGGLTYDEFGKKVRDYDSSVMCGLVWTANFVAYRCRTCGISPCMSMCSDCFQAGNHEGHDYNMFRSQAGGACDCGDTSVMKAEGFCARHGETHDNKPSATPPTDLMAVPLEMMPRLFLRLLLYLREQFAANIRLTRQSYNHYMPNISDLEPYLNFLQSLSDMGAAMRRVMTQALICEVTYKKSTDDSLQETEKKNYALFGEELAKTSVYPSNFKNYKGRPGLAEKMEYKTIMDELLFWVVQFEFPQRLVTFLLGLLPDDTYKEAFSRAFVKHYYRISMVLMGAKERTTVANRIVHISVQLFSNEQLAVQLTSRYSLLHVVILSLGNMIQSIRVASSLEDVDFFLPDVDYKSSRNFHCVVNCEHEIMKDHCYWPVVSDLINVLSHRGIALKFLQDPDLMVLWLDLLTDMQGMNVNMRELNHHVEFEPDTYYAAFSAELEISASPMWSLLMHCQTPETYPYVLEMIKASVVALQDWFEAISFTDAMKPISTQLTFHLPLHRYLSMFIMTAVNVHGHGLFGLLPDVSTLQKVMMHVLQIQVCLTQIYAGMWVRNGIQIKGQAMTYIQCHFCYSMSDADIYLLQLCATKLDPDFFVQTVIDRYQIGNWLSYSPDPVNTGASVEAEHELAMVEGALSFFCSLLGVHTYLGVSEADLMRKEMASLLCMNDRQHSTLLDLMPEKTGVSGLAKELFEPTLKELADYKQPDFESSGGLQQGTYMPKASVWENEFDPVHVSQRAIYRRDMQSASDRYANFVKSHKNYKKKTSPWPPFLIKDDVNPTYRGIYRLLQSKVMHAFLFTVLHKAVTHSQSLPENILCYTVHLLEMCVQFAPEFAPDEAPPSPAKKTSSLSVPDSQLSAWFPSSDLRVNACCTVGQVLVTSTCDPDGDPSLTPGMTPGLGTDVEMSSLEELFQISPSTGVFSSSGPITSAQMGQVPTPAMVPIPSISGSQPASPPVTLGLHLPSPPVGLQGHPAKVKVLEHRGTATAHQVTKGVSINDSLASLLVKLHTKLAGAASYKPAPLTVATVGDGALYVACLLDRLHASSPALSASIDEACRAHTTGKSKAGPSGSEKDSKRRKAWNRQQKLMAEFASKQKSFLEQNMETEDSSVDPEPSSSPTTSGLPSKEYDCVICSQSTPSTKHRLVGLVVFLQATSVLGHRHQKEQENTLTLSDSNIQRYQKGTCGKVYKRKFETLQKTFDEKSAELSINIGWEGGVLARTCGHYLHLDCHKSYLDSLHSQSQAEVLAVNKREYWCPLCRQLSNTVVPIVPEEHMAQQVKMAAGGAQDMLATMAGILRKPPLSPLGNSNLNEAMTRVMEDLTNITYPSYRTFTQTPNAESVMLFMASMLRTNLEVELLQRGGSLAGPSVAGVVRKPCLVPILQILGQHCRVLVPDCPYVDLMSLITGRVIDEEPKSPSDREVPLLLKDPMSLLIQLVLTLANYMQTEHYDFLVQQLYNLVYVQALVYLSLKFPDEERDDWRRKGRQSQITSLGGLLSHVINWLSRTELYEEESPSLKLPAICQSVWSPLSVEQTVQEHCLPYLRAAALLKGHLFTLDIPTVKDQTEFHLLATFLSLAPPDAPEVRPAGNSASAARRTSSGPSSTSCVAWLVEEPHAVMRTWFTHAGVYINAHKQEAKTILQMCPSWQAPGLISLPKRYYQIFQMYRSAKCSLCKRAPKDPAICLVCGQFVCFREICCSQNAVFESVAHSISCGAGTGIYLLVNSSIVIVIRGPRATPWGSVYLDEHGEEDRDLKRGKPLFLSSSRFSLLEGQWLAHTFDHSCKRWIWHRDQL